MTEAAPQYDEATLKDLADRVAATLPRYGLGPTSAITLLNVSENATYLISDAATGTHSILRVHRTGYHTQDSVLSELAWLEALRRENVAEVIEPVADQAGTMVQRLRDLRGGQERFAVMFAFMAGKEPSSSDDLVPWFERLGELTARLHGHAKTWARPPGFSRQIWDVDAMHGTRHFWGPWQAAIGLDRPGFAVIERAVAKVRERLAAFGQGRDRFGLIHADLRLANLLIDGARLKLLDFDDCGFSWFMYDFASAISFYEHLPNVPALRDAWLKGYSTIAPVTADDHAILPTLVMARRILLMAWIASHGEVPIARELGATYTAQSVTLAEAYLRDRFLAD